MAMHLMELPRRVVVGSEIIPQVGAILKDLDLGQRAFVVSGNNARTLLGPQLESALAGSGYTTQWDIVGPSVFEEVNRIAQISQNARSQFLVGVGGGKSIDVAKLASFESKIPFVSIPTSASHDGISSPFGSVKGTGRPYSLVAKPPICIIADVGVIAGAPPHLLVSGCGDLISKKTAVLDWELSHERTGEYFGRYSANLAMLSADLVMNNSRSISARETEGIRVVVEALISSGVAAGIAGSSRPCSGSEHLFSHAMDVVAPGKGMHGEKCGIGTIMMGKLHGIDHSSIREALSSIGAPVTAKEIGASSEEVVKAIVLARTIRKERYTILNEANLTEESARELAKETRVL